MTKKETWAPLLLIKNAYPTSFGKLDNETYENLCTIFSNCLENYPAEIVYKGFLAFYQTDTKGYPPTAGQIIDQINKLQHKDELLPSNAWNLVVRAIKNGNYGAEEEFDRLPPLVQKTIGSPQYLRDCASDCSFNASVARGQFEKNYSILIEREKYNSLLSMSINIESLNLRMLNDNNPEKQ